MTRVIRSLICSSLVVLQPGCTEILGLGRITFIDAGVDAGPIDAGPTDGGFDGGPGDAGPLPEGVPQLLFPVNGANTGSVFAPEGAPIADHPLRPRLMWLPVAGVEEYEVQMDDSCPRTGFRACTFPSPELVERSAGEAAPVGEARVFHPSTMLPVSLTPPVGARYVWRVRACNTAGCGEWSEPRYLDVGRQQSDFNGDGYADVAVGAPDTFYALSARTEASPGRVFVHYGAATGPSSAATQLELSPTRYGDGFGAALAAGDIDGDGYADLVGGAPFRSNNEPAEAGEGQVLVFFGGEGGLSTSPDWVIDNPADRAGGAFGAAVAYVGDFDGDGAGELVLMGAPRDGATFADDREGVILFGSTVCPPALYARSRPTLGAGFVTRRAG